MMPLFDVFITVEAEDSAQAILGFLYPDGELTAMDVRSISVTPIDD